MNITELIKANLTIASLFLLNCKIETSDFRKSYKYIAPYYDDQWYAYIDAVTEDIVTNIAHLKPDRILDLGCGTGGSTLKLRKMYNDSFIVALDFSKHMLRLAREKLGYHNILFVRESIERGIRKLPEAKFDLITCFWSLGYARDKKIYKQIQRVLSDGGHVLILTNKQDTLKAVHQSMKYSMIKHHDKINRLPLHKFPKNKEYLLNKFGKKFKEVSSGEGNFSIDITQKPSVVEWLLNTGILAGYEFVLNLRTDKTCRKTFNDYIKANFKEVTHNYMWLLLQKQ